MANTDSFIDEVNEELRRDRLFALFRKWGWIPILLVLLIVGGAAYREYSLAQERAAAQAFGDALIAALDAQDGAERVAALQQIDPPGEPGETLLALLLAAEQANAGDGAAAAASLRAIAEQPGLSARYRDLALFKAHLLDPQDSETAMATLQTLAEPGAPYRALALEQQALLHVENGDIEAAIEILRALEEDSQATPGLQQRTSQLIVALEAGSTLQDAPAEEPVEAAEEDDPVQEDETPAPEADADAEAGAAETTE